MARSLGEGAAAYLHKLPNKFWIPEPDACIQLRRKKSELFGKNVCFETVLAPATHYKQ
jgi:hypothetical protein